MPFRYLDKIDLLLCKEDFGTNIVFLMNITITTTRRNCDMWLKNVF